jgi:hypothetical protein
MMAKINLIQVKGNSFYCDSVFSIGVYIKEKMAELIDSGISKDVAKEVDKSLTQANIQVAAIINTLAMEIIAEEMPSSNTNIQS